MTKLLLDKGAKVNAKDGGGATAPMIASGKGYREIVDMLKAYGAKE